jgi:hypothetical protein
VKSCLVPARRAGGGPGVAGGIMGWGCGGSVWGGHHRHLSDLSSEAFGRALV